MKNILIGDAPDWLCESLKQYGFFVYKLGTCDMLPTPVCGHTDLLASKIEDTLFIAKEKEKTVKEYFKSGVFKDLRILFSDIPLGDTYPKDVPLNFVSVGDFIICNKKTVLKGVLPAAEKMNKKLIHVSQGYTKCSTLVVDDHSVITDDESIFKEAGMHMDISLVSKGSVSLPGYNYGFIGGTAVKVSDTVYFFGSLDSHPDAEKICEFISKRNLKIVSLSDEHKLIDIGGAIVL